MADKWKTRISFAFNGPTWATNNLKIMLLRASVWRNTKLKNIFHFLTQVEKRICSYFIRSTETVLQFDGFNVRGLQFPYTSGVEIENTKSRKRNTWRLEISYRIGKKFEESKNGIDFVEKTI